MEIEGEPERIVNFLPSYVCVLEFLGTILSGI